MPKLEISAMDEHNDIHDPYYVHRDVGRFIFEAEFDVYLNYIEFMESFLYNEQKKEAMLINNYLKEHSQEPRDIALVKTMGLYSGNLIEISGLMRESFFISLFAYFENKLISECRSLKPNVILLDIDDIRAGDVIERVKKYYTKVLRVKFPTNSAEWETIQDYRRIRNCIVHAHGSPDEMKDKKDRVQLQRFVNKNENIRLIRKEVEPISFAKSNGDIYIERGFCEEACQTMRAFLIDLLFPDEQE
jgi:hypothetical protein